MLAAYGIPVPARRSRRRRRGGEARRGGDARGRRARSRSSSSRRDVSAQVRRRRRRARRRRAAAEAGGGGAGDRRRVRGGAPAARVDGFALQPMVRRPEAQELILGVGARPDVRAGRAVRRRRHRGRADRRHRASALPPLDTGARGRAGRRGRGSAACSPAIRGRPPADAAALHRALIALSHLVEDFPACVPIDVNPLLADAHGVLALDARIEIEPADIGRPAAEPDLAIRPYPAELAADARGRRRAATRSARSGRQTRRSIRASSQRIDPEDLRMRFLAPRQELPRGDGAAADPARLRPRDGLRRARPPTGDSPACRGWSATPTAGRRNIRCWCARTCRAAGSARR